MGTTAKPRGKTANLLFGTQTAFDTAAIGNYISTFFYSENLGESEPFEQNPLIGLARNNNRDATEPQPGLLTASGDIVVPLDANHFPYWLTMLFGAPVTSGAGPYTHVWTSGSEELPWRTIEVEKRAGAAFYQNIGVVTNGFSLDATRGGGFRQVTLNCLARNQVKLSSTGGGSPAAMVPTSLLPASQGLLRVNSVLAGNFLGASINYQNGFSEDGSINGTKFVAGFDLDDEAQLTGNGRVRYVDDTYFDIMSVGDPVALELEFGEAADAKINFAMPAVRFDRAPFAPINGPGRLESEFGFRAEQTTGAPMLTVTVTNNVDSYAV
ncbi:phage tail tube protein [Labrenzia sp. DG1229]|uniref:phage tail tube protein n=1 Tax=Labrenzia sp. DG1229 TaxID=681847 RepID=UPI00048A4E9F|nr:phage tail tube protein [Labrenzia sp. DG1229]